MTWRVILGLGFMMAPWAAALAVDVSIDSDRMLRIDGRRAFVLGLYENPSDDKVLDDVASAGFNLVSCSASADALERLHRRKLFAWINTGDRIDLGTNERIREQDLSELATQYGRHPALLVWEVPDEALWNVWYSAVLWRREGEPRQQDEAIKGLENRELADELRTRRAEVERLYRAGQFSESEAVADDIWQRLGKTQPRPGLNLSNAASRAETLRAGMIRGYQRLKQLDPHHPIWMNHAPRNTIADLAAFNQAADIAGCDIYPAPAFKQGHSDLVDRSLSAVGAYTDRMQTAAPGKPVWMVLQAFGWADLAQQQDAKSDPDRRRPTAEELRLMVYDAIVHGARGILFWGSAFVEKDSQLWRELLLQTRELASSQQILSAPDAGRQPAISIEDAWGSADGALKVLAKDVGGNLALIVVNEWPEPLHGVLSGLDVPDGTLFADPPGQVSATVSDGLLRLTLAGHGVHVLQQVPKP